MDQDVSEFTNIFHALGTKLGIKEFVQNWALKYHDIIHKYIQDDKEFLDICSPRVSYRYPIKIKKKFKGRSEIFDLQSQSKGKAPQNCITKEKSKVG